MTFPQAIAAAILWIATVAVVVVTVAEQGDLCHPSGWTERSWLAVAFLAAGAMFASLEGRLIAKVTAAAFI